MRTESMSRTYPSRCSLTGIYSKIIKTADTNPDNEEYTGIVH